jgi:tetratricopeptide (TPR) repeat protein
LNNKDNTNFLQNTILTVSSCYIHHGPISETIENIVKYFLHLGEIKGADELQIISLTRNTSEESAMKTADYYLQANCCASCMESHQTCNLWLTFLVASLLNNTERMLQSASELVSSKPYSGFELVEAFVLLQSNRPGLALEGLLNNENVTKQFKRPIFDIGSALYRADCYMGLETDGMAYVPSLLEKALGVYKKTGDRGPTQQSPHDHLLQAIIYNNRGIAHVMEGNMDLAGEYFKEACKALEDLRLLHAYNCSSLQPYFNLTLLHLCKGSMHGAMETWMSGRRMSSFVNALSTTELQAMFRHALKGYHAQVRGGNETTESFGASSRYTLHIHSWSSQCPERTHAFLLDCIILLFALEKRQLYVFSLWANNEA